MNKKVTCMIIVFIMLLSSAYISVFAANPIHIDKIFSDLKNEDLFLPKLYTAGALYKEQGVTNESINAMIRQLIHQIIDRTIVMQNEGKLTEDNFNEQMKELTMTVAQEMEPLYLSVCFDAFDESMLNDILKGNIPKDFRPLYELIVNEAKEMVGSPTMYFYDLADYDWAYEAIGSLYNLKIINGMGDNAFAPSQTVKREQFVKMLAVAFQIGSEDAQSNFSDVKQDDWFYPFVCAMVSEGLVNGYEGQLFGTGFDISRQDMAVLLYRIGIKLGVLENKPQTGEFADQAEIANYAYIGVMTLKSMGILKGTPEGKFNPKNSATRAEATQMIYNFYNFINN